MSKEEVVPDFEAASSYSAIPKLPLSNFQISPERVTLSHF
jgi:hypothetical protein